MQNTKLKSLEASYETFNDDVQTVEAGLETVEVARLYQLADSIDWLTLENEIVPILGSRSGPIVRLVCGTVFLKSFYELSFDEVIEKWQFYPTFRYFCGEDASIEGAGAFPIPLYSLTILANALNGRGNEAMISALLEATTDDMPLEMMAIH